MIKKFKIFENVSQDEPKIDDWIIDHDGDVGKIINIENFHNMYFEYTIDFKPELQRYYPLDRINRSDIKFFGTKKFVELQIQANKYNI